MYHVVLQELFKHFMSRHCITELLLIVVVIAVWYICGIIKLAYAGDNNLLVFFNMLILHYC